MTDKGFFRLGALLNRNEMQLTAGGTEILRIDRDGTIYVSGKPGASDAEIVTALRDWAAKLLR